MPTRVPGGAGGARLYLPPFRFDVVLRPRVPRVVPLHGLAEVARRALLAAGAPAPATVGLILSDDAELTRLNRQAMGVEGPTDVLSFPLLPAAAFPPHEGQAAAQLAGTAGGAVAAGPAEGFVLPPGTRPHLGEIVVSVERAITQAEAGRGGQTGDVRWSPADELRLLVAHGALHLCGWDHAAPAEQAAMRSLEQRILEGAPA
ncbi:MAG TPA: rRNA maturation RNase YbeY [Candidatus Limnocylindrales bacterium]|nr:rRNA maturation RNase YbeY [Candidatus Limnocylindrales bacterium]